MTTKERRQMDIMNATDVFRLIHKAAKKKGYDVPVEAIRTIFECYADMVYTCLINGIRISMPYMGEYYRAVRKGRKEGYYNVPNSRDEHTKFDKNMVWTKEYMEKAPDWGRIKFVEFPRIKRKFREDTTGKI